MNRHPVSAMQMDQAAAVLRAGGLVAFPTETVYGLGADARNVTAVERIFAVKGRPADHPVIVHLGDARQLDDWARDIPKSAWTLAEAFWPGPLTLVLPRRAGVPDAVTGGLDTVALRVPGHPVALALLAAFGDGVAAPSANRYGRVSPTMAEHVREELGDAVDLVLDGGRCEVGIESTILDLSTPAPSLLRPGAITEDALNRSLGSPLATAVNANIRSPGRKPSHYSPQARVVLVCQDEVEHQVELCRRRGQRVGVLSSRRPVALPDCAIWLRFGGSVREQAHELYRSLRLADHLGLQILVAVMPPDKGLGRALRDRLLRAAGLGDGTEGPIQPTQMTREHS
ncbi:MAG: L-threonylcarbamoyladenylate synthase [Dokdonella sp.]